MKKLWKLAVAIVAICGQCVKADQDNLCVMEFASEIQRQTLAYYFDWDYWEAIYYPDGWFYAQAFGPVVVTPYILPDFDAASYPGNVIRAFLSETHVPASIWRMEGNASLYKIYSGGDLSFPPSPGHPEGAPVSASCTGYF